MDWNSALPLAQILNLANVTHHHCARINQALVLAGILNPANVTRHHCAKANE